VGGGRRSDADMPRMMADENREEFKDDHLVAIETISATIEAFGRGEIELPPVAKDTPKSAIFEVAPSGATYTASTVARFLSWTKRHGDDREPQPTNPCRLAFEAYHKKANIVPTLATLPEDDRSRQATSTVLRARSVRRAAPFPAARARSRAVVGDRWGPLRRGRVGWRSGSLRHRGGVRRSRILPRASWVVRSSSRQSQEMRHATPRATRADV
jgi:hypothetical protein